MSRGTFILCAVLLAIVIASVDCAPSEYSVPLGATNDEEWEYYKTYFSKAYDTPEENARRKSIYFEKKAIIDAHNKRYEAGEFTYTKGINHFADLTEEEFKKVCCGVIIPKSEQTRRKREAFEVAEGTSIDDEWLAYKKFFNKTYAETEEDARRKANYIETKKKIEAHNKKFAAGEVTYTQGINHFADLTEEEFKKQHLTGIVLPESEKSRRKRDAFTVPEGTSIDDEWTAFKKFFNKTYDGEEEAKRKAIYVATKKKVEEHNKKYAAGEVLYSQGINHSADLTEEEFKKTHTGIILPKEE